MGGQGKKMKMRDFARDQSSGSPGSREKSNGALIRQEWLPTPENVSRSANKRSCRRELGESAARASQLDAPAEGASCEIHAAPVSGPSAG